MFTGRYTAEIDGSFVVFLIGARVNRPWKLLKLWSMSRAMARMQKELLASPEHGCLHVENWAGRTTVSVQYWRSFEHLEAYARNRDAAHLPAWRDFNRKVGASGDIGIWHETYPVSRGEYETIYCNMPRFGLGMAGQHSPLEKRSTAALRSGVRDDDQAPVSGY